MLVPNLTTALPSSILELERICLDKQCEIEYWFRHKWAKHHPPFYGSVDLRNSGFKLTTVDMNLFPGGFNNINPEFYPLATLAANNILEKSCPDVRKILLIPENHTKNLAYLDNVAAILHILSQTGIEIRIGSLSEEITTPTVMRSANGQELTYYPLVRNNDTISTTDGFCPCLIILNNDLSAGKPPILAGIKQQLLPPLNAGWYMRKKTNFFSQYSQVAKEFAEILAIDPWRIDAYFSRGQDLDFANKTGLEELASKVDEVLTAIRSKYTQYGIQENPYVIVKANSGTYGMGIMVVKSANDILAINRKSRNKMAVIKDGQSVSDVIIQEGVHTFEEIDGKVAEPVVYMVNNAVIGGFYRVHPNKGRDENLNSVGADFIKLEFASNCLPSAKCSDKESSPNRFYTYGVMARLALLASSLEISKYL